MTKRDSELRKHPAPIPLRAKVDPKLKHVTELLDSIATDFECDSDDALEALAKMAEEVLQASLALQHHVTYHIDENFVKPRKDPFKIELGSTVRIKERVRERYAVDETFSGILISYGKLCTVECDDDGSRMRV